MLPLSIFLCLVSNVTRVYLSLSCAQWYTCLSFCVLCLMLPVSIFLCLGFNVTCIYLSVSCAHCYPCLSFCVLCPMLTVSVFLCLVSNVARIYLSVSCVQWCFLCLKITQNYLLVLFLINIYSQEYHYTLKYSYRHYMVFVVSVTIFSVLQFLFCLQLFIYWLIITTLCILHLQTWKYQSFDKCFLEDFLLVTNSTDFW